jgi:hypothetical protein
MQKIDEAAIAELQRVEESTAAPVTLACRKCGAALVWGRTFCLQCGCRVSVGVPSGIDGLLGFIVSLAVYFTVFAVISYVVHDLMGPDVKVPNFLLFIIAIFISGRLGVGIGFKVFSEKPQPHLRLCDSSEASETSFRFVVSLEEWNTRPEWARGEPVTAQNLKHLVRNIVGKEKLEKLLKHQLPELLKDEDPDKRRIALSSMGHLDLYGYKDHIFQAMATDSNEEIRTLARLILYVNKQLGSDNSIGK